MTLYAMIVAATMVGMFDFCKMAKSGLEKRQIGKKRKEADERHATLFSFYCLPLRYILTPDHNCLARLLAMVVPFLTVLQGFRKGRTVKPRRIRGTQASHSKGIT